MKEFAEALAVDDPNAEFWWQFMTTVSILLSFTREQRDGLWDLHLYSFKRMLPYFFRYDHVKYARWGTVYLAEMSTLPPEVLLEFQEGNFVVKRTERRFNQVSADQSTEWLNVTGKKSSGLVGITRINSALNRWTLEKHGVLHDSDATLKNIINKDIVTQEIQESLLAAESLGLSQMRTFVDKRLCQTPDSDMHLDLKAPIQKNKAKTFASLYEVVNVSKGKKTLSP